MSFLRGLFEASDWGGVLAKRCAALGQARAAISLLTSRSQADRKFRPVVHITSLCPLPRNPDPH